MKAFQLGHEMAMVKPLIYTSQKVVQQEEFSILRESGVRKQDLQGHWEKNIVTLISTSNISTTVFDILEIFFDQALIIVLGKMSIQDN